MNNISNELYLAITCNIKSHCVRLVEDIPIIASTKFFRPFDLEYLIEGSLMDVKCKTIWK